MYRMKAWRLNYKILKLISEDRAVLLVGTGYLASYTKPFVLCRKTNCRLEFLHPDNRPIKTYHLNPLEAAYSGFGLRPCGLKHGRSLGTLVISVQG